jgi:hypothetical protein
MVRGNICAESRANANTAIDSEQRDNREIGIRLYHQTVIFNILKNGMVLLFKDFLYNGLQVSMDITRRGCVFSTEKTRAKLPNGD